MQEGDLVTSDVMSYTSRVLVNGVDRSVISWSVEREMSGGLPAQVVAAAGLTQATGNIVWASDTELTDGGLNPWNRATGWTPVEGDRVEIYAGDGVSEWKQFHGLIDKTTGSINDGFQSSVIDDHDKFSAEFELQAMLRVMPPDALGGAEYRSVGLHPLFYVDYALRRSGFHCTPAREYDSALFAPLQGSRWAHFGYQTYGVGGLNRAAPWGLGVEDCTAWWSIGGAASLMSAPTQVSLLVAPNHAGPATVSVSFGSTTDRLSLYINAARVASAQKNGVTVATLALGESLVISMLAKNGVLELATSDGRKTSGKFTASGSGMSQVRLSATMDANVAGLQVSRPAVAVHEHAATRWVPSARLDTTNLAMSGIIDAAPMIEKRTAGSLLSEISEATLSPMWIDEKGVFQWVPSYVLRSRPVSTTLTSADNILGLEWESGLLSTASKVTVRGRKPHISKGRWRNIKLAEGNMETIKSLDELEVFLEPETDTDWIMPQTSFLEIGGENNSWASYNNPSLATAGLYYTADGGTTTVTGLTCAISAERLGFQKFLIKYLAGSWPSGVEGVLATSPTNTSLWPKNRNQPAIRLPGGGKVKWDEIEVSAVGAGGPGPELVHEAGVWLNRTSNDEMLMSFASFIQGQTASPKPVIAGLRVIPDPRIQLGDVIMIESQDLMGVKLKALITGVSNNFGATLEQSLTVRVIGSENTFTTYQELDKSLGSIDLTYQQWQVLGPPQQTYTQFNKG